MSLVLLLLCRKPNPRHLDGEVERLACERMVGVDGDDITLYAEIDWIGWPCSPCIRNWTPGSTSASSGNASRGTS